MRRQRLGYTLSHVCSRGLAKLKADRVFVCAVPAEVAPVPEIDDRKVGAGSRGPITEKVQSTYFNVVKGAENLHPEWRARV